MNRRTPALAAAAVVGVLVTGAVLLGLDVRSTEGGQAAVDEPQYLLSALSLAEDGDLDIADELAAQRYQPFHQAELPVQTRVRDDGSQVSPHDPLLPLLLAAPIAAGGWMAAKVTLAVLAGLLAATSTWVAARRFAVPLPMAAAVCGVAGTSAPLVVYGQQVYPELLAALLVVAAVAALTGRLRTGGTVVLVLAVIALPWAAVKYAPVAAAFAALGLHGLWRKGSRGAAGAAAAVLVAAGVVFLAVHRAVYGGWTAYASGDHFAARGELSAVGFAPDYLGRSVRLVGLLVDRDFGLVAWQPAWLLAVPALAAVLRLRPPHWPVLVLPLLAGWLTATFVALTMHGFWWLGRQVVVVLPLAALLVAVWMSRLTGRVRTSVAGVGVALGVLGWLAYAWLVTAGTAGRLTWVAAPELTAGPAHDALRALLPDYRDASAGDWLRHALWTAALALAAVAAWWHAGRAAASTPATAPVARTPRPADAPSAVPIG